MGLVRGRWHSSHFPREGGTLTRAVPVLGHRCPHRRSLPASHLTAKCCFGATSRFSLPGEGEEQVKVFGAPLPTQPRWCWESRSRCVRKPPRLPHAASADKEITRFPRENRQKLQQKEVSCGGSTLPAKPRRSPAPALPTRDTGSATNFPSVQPRDTDTHPPTHRGLTQPSPRQPSTHRSPHHHHLPPLPPPLPPPDPAARLGSPRSSSRSCGSPPSPFPAAPRLRLPLSRRRGAQPAPKPSPVPEAERRRRRRGAGGAVAAATAAVSATSR